MPNKRYDNKPSRKSEGFLEDFQSFLSEVDKIFPASEYLDIVGDFLESYTKGSYEDAYEQLASMSPLRQGLSSQEWVAQRRQWDAAAHPARFRIAFIEDTEGIDDVERYLTNEDTLEQPVVEVGWSLQFAETPLTSQLPEIPTATAVLKETGRHWFWTRYTLVEEDDEWFIDRMIDEGANALKLEITEIEQRLDTIAELASERLTAMEDEDDLEDEDDDEDLDEDDDEEDDDLDDEDFMDTLLEMEEAFRVMTKGTHYNDALIAQSPDSDTDPYEQNVRQAMVTNDMERAAVYLQLLAEHFPEQQSKAKEQLGLAYYGIAQAYEEEDQDEEGDQGHTDESRRFKELAEATLRSVVEADGSIVAYLALAKLVFAQDRLDEAKALLQEVRSLSPDQKQLADVEVGLGLIAKKEEETEQALSHFQRVVELNPDYEALWYNIGVLQSKLGRYEEAIANLKRNIEVSPEQTAAYVELASIYTTQKTLAKARQILQEGLQWNAEAPDLLAELSIVYIQSNDLRTAHKYLQQAEDADDEHELVQKARALYNERRVQQRMTISPNRPQPPRHHKKKR